MISMDRLWTIKKDYDSRFLPNSTPLRERRTLGDITKRRIPLAAGIGVYTTSFFFWAVGDFMSTANPLRGYYCATFALLYPWRDGKFLLPERPLEYFSLLISGWINPIFVITLVSSFFKEMRSIFIILRNLTVLMIPFCWVVFHYENFYPREGHIFWIAGMLLTLFVISERNPRPPKEQNA
jgi:hypothetical protein